MMFFLYIERLYTWQLMYVDREDTKPFNGKYYDVLIYWTTLYPTVSWQLMYVDREDTKPQR